MTALPTWLVVVLRLVGPAVALAALFAAELRDRRRLSHEREMQHILFEEQRLSTLRDNRFDVYSNLSRRTKVIRATPPQESAGDLVEILSEVELLTDDEDLLKTAAELVVAASRARMVAWRHYENRGTQEEVDAASEEVTNHRVEFIRRAREELQQRPGSDTGSLPGLAAEVGSEEG